jgi:hypothetical protein
MKNKKQGRDCTQDDNNFSHENNYKWILTLKT